MVAMGAVHAAAQVASRLALGGWQLNLLGICCMCCCVQIGLWIIWMLAMAPGCSCV